MAGQYPLKVVITAVDRVTAPLQAINRQVSRFTAPFRRLSGRLSALGDAAGLNRVGAAAKNVGARFGEVASSIGSAVRQLSLLGGIAFGALGFLIKRTADAGDAAFKTAQKVGVSVEAWQELAYAAELADVDQQQLSTTLQRLTKNAAAAATGSKEMSTWFRRVGVNVLDSNGKLKQSDKLFSEISDKFAKMPDGARKTALAIGVFGKAGAELIPMLNGGSEAIARAAEEARKLGIIMSDEDAKSAEEFNDNITRMMRSLDGLARIVGNALIPIANDLAIEFREWVIANRELVATKAKEWFEWLRDNLPAIKDGISNAFTAIGKMISVVDGIAEAMGGWKVVMAALAAVMIGQFIVAVGQLVYSLGTLGVVFATNPIGMFVTAVSGAILVIWKLVEAWNAMNDAAGKGDIRVTTGGAASSKPTRPLTPAEQAAYTYSGQLPEDAKPQPMVVRPEALRAMGAINANRLDVNSALDPNKLEVTVDFMNMPKGVRASATADAGTSLMVNRGYAMPGVGE